MGYSDNEQKPGPPTVSPHTALRNFATLKLNDVLANEAFHGIAKDQLPVKKGGYQPTNMGDFLAYVEKEASGMYFNLSGNRTESIEALKLLARITQKLDAEPQYALTSKDELKTLEDMPRHLRVIAEGMRDIARQSAALSQSLAQDVRRDGIEGIEEKIEATWKLGQAIEGTSGERPFQYAQMQAHVADEQRRYTNIAHVIDEITMLYQQHVVEASHFNKGNSRDI